MPDMTGPFDIDWKGRVNSVETGPKAPVTVALLLEHMHPSQDSQPAHRLNIDRRLLSRIRNRWLNITGSMLILMHESSGIPVTALKQMLKDGRKTSSMECRLMAAGHKG